MSSFALLLILITARPPVTAERPVSTARAASVVVIDAGRVVQAMYRARRSGMLKTEMAQRESDAAFKKMSKDPSVRAFAIDKSLSVESKVRRLFKWLLNRPPKPAEMNSFARHLRRSKAPHEGLIDITWALYQRLEFLRGKPMAAK